MSKIMEGISPLPWRGGGKEPISKHAWIEDANGHNVANMHASALHVFENSEANAAYIAHACNLYPELVEALEKLLIEEPEQDPSSGLS
jgi:hypothetical protein